MRVDVEERDEIKEPEAEEKVAFGEDLPEDTPHGETDDSLEERIKEHEFELNIELLKIKRQAEQMIVEAEEKAAQIKQNAEKESSKEKEISHQKGIEKLREEEEQIRLKTVEDVKSLEEKARKKLDRAIKKIIDSIT